MNLHIPVEPVSYTHLDVYKRQTLHISLIIGSHSTKILKYKYLFLFKKNESMVNIYFFIYFMHK